MKKKESQSGQMLIELIVATMIITMVMLFFSTIAARNIRSRVKYLYQLQATHYASELIETAYNYAANNQDDIAWLLFKDEAQAPESHFVFKNDGELYLHASEEICGDFTRHLKFTTDIGTPNEIEAWAIVEWEYEGREQQIALTTTLVNLARVNEAEDDFEF